MKEVTKKMLLDKLNISVYPERKQGGQTCGIITRGIKLSSDLGIEISVNNYRSHHKNRELAFLLMDLAIEEVMK